MSTAQDSSRNSARQAILPAILSDVQFWIPLGVLIAGLLLLSWLS